MPKKILIAEDDKYLASAYRVKLQKSDFDVKIASNGEQALAELKTFKPDLLLLDLVMPQKDGFYVLEQMQSDPQLKKVPVIVASNLGQPEDIDKAKKLGAKDYIVKSNMSLADIINKIKSQA